MPTFRHVATLGQPTLTLPDAQLCMGPLQGPCCGNAVSSSSSLVFPAQNASPALCLSHEVRQWVLVSHQSKSAGPASQASLPFGSLNRNFLYLSALCWPKKQPSLSSPPPQALQSLALRQGAAVGRGADAADIGILLAVRLNNLMAIRRAAVVEGEGAQGEDL